MRGDYNYYMGGGFWTIIVGHAYFDQIYIYLYIYIHIYINIYIYKYIYNYVYIMKFEEGN